jgi:hypothetical protein
LTAIRAAPTIELMGRALILVLVGPALLGACAGSGKPAACAGVTCAAGRTCVEGLCLEPDGGAIGDTQLVDTKASVELAPLPDGSREGAPADHSLPADQGGGCPDPAAAAGSYSGSFVDGLGGSLAKGNLTFTLQASATGLSLAGTIDGTALPGIKNYAIKGTLAGGVACAAVSAKITGKLDGNAFTGELAGTLQGQGAVGTWNGAGSGIAVNGAWSVTRK